MHNHQPPTALLLAAPLQKVGDVPKKHPDEMGVYWGLPRQRKTAIFACE